MKKENGLKVGGQGHLQVFVSGLLALGLFVQDVTAVMIKGSGNPEANTTAPTGALAGSGWQYQGQFGGFLGTVIAPQYFLAARHVGGSVGQEFLYNGVSYRTTASWDEPNSDLRIWKVDGYFSNWAPMYSQNDEAGKSFVVIGRGTQRGEAIVISALQTNYTTNVTSLKSLGITKKDAQKLFPDAKFSGPTMTVITSEVISNSFCRGWKSGSSDGRMRWGENQVLSADFYLVASFDDTGSDNEAYLSGGDSSGAAFIQEGGVWKLAAINYGVDGPWAVSESDAPFYGAIVDQSGLYKSGIPLPNDGLPRPARFYMTRISNRLSWIQSIITQ